MPAWHFFLHPSRLPPKFFTRAARTQKKQQKEKRKMERSRKLQRKAREEGEEKKKAPSSGELNSCRARGT